MRRELPRDVVAPTRTDPVARSLSEVVGGPVGQHALPHRWWTPVRVLLAVTTLGFVLSLVHRVPCMETDWSKDQARYAKMCYSDVPYLYTGRGLAEGLWPYADNGGRYRVMEYPVGISYVAWVVARVNLLRPAGPPLEQRHHGPPSELWGEPGMAREVNRYFLLTALVIFGCLLGTTALLAGVHRRRPWDALPWALSPALLVTDLINWDMLAVVLVAGALWAWARGRPVLTGVLVGLGTATKLYPVFLLVGVVLISWRRRRPWDAVLAVACAAGAWALAQVPAWLSGIPRWEVFWRFNSVRGADLGSWWLVLEDAGTSVSAHTINTWSWAFVAAVCAGVTVLALRAPRPPRLAQLGFLVVAGFLLVNKVYSPQYVLWLLPLAVLARPRWRDLLVWQAGELLYFAFVWLYLGGWLADPSGNAPFYDVAIVLRMLAELYLAAVIVRDVARGEPLEGQPEAEPERSAELPA